MSKHEKMAGEFRENGYVILKGHLSQSAIEEIFLAIGAVFDRGFSALHEDAKGLSLDDKYKKLALRSPAFKARCYDLLGYLEPLYRHVLTEDIPALGKEIFQSNLLLDGMQVRIGEPQNDRLIPFHQDFGHLSRLNLNVWTALSPANVESGGLKIIPRTHLLGRVPHQYYHSSTGEYHGIVPEVLVNQQETTLDMDPGDTVFFHPYLFHASAENRSQNLRWTSIVRLNELSEVSYLRNEGSPLRWPQHSESFGDV